MASIRQLKSGKFNVQIRLKGNKPLSKSFDSIEHAQQWIQEQEPQRPSPQSSTPTFWELSALYCTSIKSRRASHEIAYPRLKRISCQLPNLVTDIKPQHINDYKNKRLLEVSGVTVRDEIQLVHRVIRWAISEFLLENILSHSPCANIKLPKPSKPRSKVVTKEELNTLLALLSPTVKVIIELAYETAMRRTEITSLQKQHIFLSDRTLMVVNGKTGDRLVPLTTRATRLLTEQCDALSNPTSRLFNIAPHSVSTALRRARQKAGLSSDIRMHQLRHTRITLAAKAGLNQQQLMIVSGHRDTRSVSRYTHLEVTDVIGLLD